MSRSINKPSTFVMMNRYRILIVDDSPDNIQAVIRCYEELHPEYVLYQATSGRAAIDLAAAIHVDIIISDWEMPGMSGIELVAALKADPKTAHIPVIIVTGVMLSASDLDAALSAGAYDYLRKPVERTELAARTNSALQLVKMHSREMAAKNIELTTKAALIARSNQFNIAQAGRLKQLETLLDDKPRARELIHTMLTEIEQITGNDNWQYFEMAFHNLHPTFCKNITKQFPNLTPGDIRLCILMRLGMKNKEIAMLLYQSPRSIKVTRSRLRKKLGIGTQTNLQSFLARF